ncbi:glycosyl hydrolase family 61-domain-containing protein [Aspergillus pseudotamarii]|uniref:Glycosyl hydrolase family 61-domain-containing protein n=1 Tax=Aspergillus pseudotamarii TaxID=132259 RepID=A0A5N6T665_ASPPS|nr:glycosyl hydrolase family 61-domain-containing protein [Aspergillus pseudotamarii]KAE8141805.1 glycosyl hydrolase family 61-domain-containing protein [Aspergillus pseudotamarii]
MSLSKVAWLILGTAGLAAAHGHIDRIDIDGKSYGGFLVDQYPREQNVPDLIAWSTADTQDAYIQTFDYNQPNIICHQDAKPGVLAGEVAAGGKVTIHWSRWFEDHRGPVISYLANCNGSCASVNKTRLEFFKIEEAGLLDNSKSPGKWASDKLMAANNTWTVNIPSDIAAGNYVLRHEIIALHNAMSDNGAQAYPQCINLKVTGGGTATPKGIPATQFYTPTDPGILVDIFNNLATYVIPGPALYEGRGATPTTTRPPTGASSSALSYSPAWTTPAAVFQGSGYVPYESSSRITPTPVASDVERNGQAYWGSQAWKRRSSRWPFSDKKHARDISI